MKYFLSIMICLLFCCNNHNEKKPKNILSETNFVKLIKDLYLAEAAFNLEKKDPEKTENNLENVYSIIYQTHKVSEEKFKKTLDYYSSKPEQLELIYSKIEADLKEELSKVDQ